MSKVIKAAVWKDNPHFIDTPEPPKQESVADMTMDDEARAHIMAEIARKEQRASEELNHTS